MSDGAHSDTKGDLHDVLARDLGAGTGPGAGSGPGSEGKGFDLEAALMAVAPLPMPSIVISIAEDRPKAVAERLGAIPAAMDDTVGQYPVKLELRFDALRDMSDRMTAAALVFRLGVPVILTLRARREGGQTTATEPDRQRFFLSLVGALRSPPPPGSLIDIEAAAVAADPSGWGQVLAAARERGFHIVLSHHDFDGTPTPDRLLPPEGLLDGVPGGPAAVWKSATTARTFEDDLAVLGALRQANAGARRAALMAMGSPTTRLLAPFFGTPLVYAAADERHAVAPGQLPFADLVHAWARWGLTVDDEALVAPLADGAGPPRLALLGRPAWQSLSPAMHNAAARAAGLSHRYMPLEIPAADIDADAPPTLDAAGQPVPGHTPDERRFLTTLRSLPALGIVGGNVTVPFKALLARGADTADPLTEQVGAANTFRYRDGHIEAHNTDPIGVTNAFQEAKVAMRDRQALVLGAGGGAAAAVAGLLEQGAAVTVANRTAERAAALANRFGSDVRTVPWDDRDAAASSADLIVQATGLGMVGGPDPAALVLSPDALGAGHAVLDMVYVPRETPLLSAAKQAGATVIDGTAMLVHQGVAAFQILTGHQTTAAAFRSGLEAGDKHPMPPRLVARSATGGST